MVEVNNSFPTINPCNQAVHDKGSRFVVILDIFWKTIVYILHDFYSLNLYLRESGGLD